MFTLVDNTSPNFLMGQTPADHTLESPAYPSKKVLINDRSSKRRLMKKSTSNPDIYSFKYLQKNSANHVVSQEVVNKELAGKQIVVVSENQFTKLKKLQYINETDSENEQDVDLGKYDPLYAQRLNKAQKRYT
jgi:hypothetical protein